MGIEQIDHHNQQLVVLVFSVFKITFHCYKILSFLVSVLCPLDKKIQQKVLIFVKEFNRLIISMTKRLFSSRDLIITVLDWFITKRRNILIEKTSPRQVGEKEKIRQFSEGH